MEIYDLSEEFNQEQLIIKSESDNALASCFRPKDAHFAGPPPSFYGVTYVNGQTQQWRATYRAHQYFGLTNNNPCHWSIIRKIWRKLEVFINGRWENHIEPIIFSHHKRGSHNKVCRRSCSQWNGDYDRHRDDLLRRLQVAPSYDSRGVQNYLFTHLPGVKDVSVILRPFFEEGSEDSE